MPSLEKYRRDLEYTYAPGIFPAMEAITKRPECVVRLLLSEKAEGEGAEKLKTLCEDKGVRVEYADRVLRSVSRKDNCFAAAVTRKWDAPLLGDRHIVLHHISDSGNLGTILRTALGMGYRDVAVIRPAADPWDPHVIRASMGAVYSLRVREYADMEAYLRENDARPLFLFMLDTSRPLDEGVRDAGQRFGLVFGNEGAGLPPEFASLGTAVRIPQTADVDSFNLSIAAAVGMYAFGNGGRNRETARA